MIVYTRANGYGAIDIDSEPFQVDRRLWEAQNLHAKIEHGLEIDPREVLDLCQWYCELVANVGQLRADYRCMVEVAEGKAEFREE